MYYADERVREANAEFIKSNGIDITDDLKDEIADKVKSIMLSAWRSPNMRFVLWIDEDGDLHIMEDLAGGNSVPTMVFEGRGIFIHEECCQCCDIIETEYSDFVECFVSDMRNAIPDADRDRFDAVVSDLDYYDTVNRLAEEFPGAFDVVCDAAIEAHVNAHIIDVDDCLGLDIEYRP